MKRFIWRILAKYKWLEWLLYICQLVSKKGRKQLTEEIKQYIEPEPSFFEKRKILFDIILSHLKYGASKLDYFEFNFYEKSQNERKKFINEGHRSKFYKQFNNQSYIEIFRQKHETYKIFEKFYGRKLIYPKEMQDYNRFLRLCSKNKTLIVKPNNTSRGVRIRKANIDGNEKTLKVLWNECVDEKLVLEEVIVAHKEIRDFHPYSLNTFRIATVLTKNDVKIMAAVFRMGNNKSIVDNHASGGIIAAVDINTGVVYTNGIDIYNNPFIFHPVSKKQIVGFKVPFWEGCKNLIIEVAKVIPEIRYVGWDVALTEKNEWVLIEGNDGGQFDLLQQADQKGRKLEFEKMI